VYPAAMVVARLRIARRRYGGRVQGGWVLVKPRSNFHIRGFFVPVEGLGPGEAGDFRPPHRQIGASPVQPGGCGCGCGCGRGARGESCTRGRPSPREGWIRAGALDLRAEGKAFA
jgi:hypothetical protein